MTKMLITSTLQKWEPWPKMDMPGLARYVTDEAARELDLTSVPFFGERPADEVLKAIYEALFNLTPGIFYGHERFHPSERLQYVRSPIEILRSAHEGTCLDLAALFCGLCMAKKLLPILIVLKDHALVAVSLKHGINEYRAYGRTDLVKMNGLIVDPTFLKRKIEENDYLPLECTGIATRRGSGGKLSFEQAVAEGQKQLLGQLEQAFEFALDIAIVQYECRIEPNELVFSEIELGPAAGQAFTALAKLVTNPDIRHAASAYKQHFQTTLSGISRVIFLKRLHDLLQDVRCSCYEVVMSQMSHFLEDALAREVLERSQIDLQKFADDINARKNSAGSEDFYANIGDLADELSNSAAKMRQATEHLDLKQLREARLALEHILAIYTPAINIQLNESARYLHLEKLVEATGSLRTPILQDGTGQQNQDTLSHFVLGTEFLVELADRFMKTTEEHDQWQLASIKLNNITGQYEEEELVELVNIVWPRLNQSIKKVLGDYSENENWAESLKKLGKEVSRALRSKDPLELKKQLNKFNRLVNHRFNDVDLALKDMCDDLRAVGQSLDSVIRVL